MSTRLTTGIALNALNMAITRCRPPAGLIHHSDRGCQYASHRYRQRLAEIGAKASMSRTGNCLDNAPCESFFGSLKTELVHDADYATRSIARREIFEYLEVYYNRQRSHSALDFLTPVEFESAHLEHLTVHQSGWGHHLNRLATASSSTPETVSVIAVPNSSPPARATSPRFPYKSPRARTRRRHGTQRLACSQCRSEPRRRGRRRDRS